VVLVKLGFNGTRVRHRMPLHTRRAVHVFKLVGDALRTLAFWIEFKKRKTNVFTLYQYIGGKKKVTE